MFRKLTSLVLALIMVLSMASFAVAEETAPVPVPEGRRVVTFWHSMTSKNLEATQYIVDQFNASQDEIWVEASYQGGYDECLTKLKSGFMAQSAPDVFMMYELGTNYLANSGYVIPFEDRLVNDPVVELDDVVDVLRNYYTVDGKMQCFPYNPSSNILYYNKTAFEAAGVELPKTLGGYADIAEALTTKGGVKYPMVIRIYGWVFENFLAGAGGYYLNNENGRAGLATALEYTESEQGKKVMELWKKLVDDGVVLNLGTNGTDCRTAFLAGDAAAYIASTANLRTIQSGADGKFEVGVAYMPVIEEDAATAVLIGGANLWMYKSGDQQRQDDAWEFVKFFAGDPQWGAYFSEQSGYFAGRKSAYETESYVAYLEANPAARVAINQLLDSPINTITAGANCGCMTELRQIWEQNFSNYLDGSCDLEETLEIMREEANSAIELYNEVNGLV